MSYTTYTTEALVCGAFDRNTADRTYLLYTRAAGMLYADAKSVREERSKQRYALQEFSHIRVSLVKGKQTWKIGSVEVVANDYVRAVSREARGSVARLYKTLRRFIRGEDASPELFDFAIEALTVLAGELPHRSFVENSVEVRLLAYLGYVDAARIPAALQGLPVSAFATAQSEENLALCTELLAEATLNSQL